VAVSDVLPFSQRTFTISETGSYTVRTVFTTGTSSATSNAVVATLPAPVTLGLPASNATGVNVLTEFTWTAGIDEETPDEFKLEISLNAEFTPVLATHTVEYPADTFTLTTPLAYNTQHHWRVIAVSALGESLENTTRSFTTQVALPGKVTLLTPTNNATNQPIKPTFTWQQPTGTVTGYYIYRGTTANPSSYEGNRVHTVDSATTTTWEYANNLPFGTAIHWQVVAFNATGRGEASDSWSFTTQVAPPGVVTLLTPLDGATNEILRPTLTW